MVWILVLIGLGFAIYFLWCHLSDRKELKESEDRMNLAFDALEYSRRHKVDKLITEQAQTLTPAKKRNITPSFNTYRVYRDGNGDILDPNTVLEIMCNPFHPLHWLLFPNGIFEDPPTPVLPGDERLDDLPSDQIYYEPSINQESATFVENNIVEINGSYDSPQSDFPAKEEEPTTTWGSAWDKPHNNNDYSAPPSHVDYSGSFWKHDSGESHYTPSYSSGDSYSSGGSDSYSSSDSGSSGGSE